MRPNQTLPPLLALSCASLLGLSFPGATRAALDPPAPERAPSAEKASSAEKPQEFPGLDLNRLHEAVTKEALKHGGQLVLTPEVAASLLKSSGMDAGKVDAMTANARARAVDKGMHYYPDEINPNAVGKDGAPLKPEELEPGADGKDDTPLKPGELFGLDLKRFKARINQDITAGEDGGLQLSITPESLATWLKDSGMDAKKVDAMGMDKKMKFLGMSSGTSLDRKSSVDLGGLNLPRFRARLKLDAAQQPGGKLTWNAAAARGWLRDNGMSAERAAALSDDEVKGLITEADASILAAPVAPGEFPADWTYDANKPAIRAQHAALEGKPMPDLDLSGWINGEVKPEDMKGKVVLLDIYATWCGPCMAGIPHNNALFKNYKDQGLVVVGVCASGQKTFADNAREHGIQYPTACDPREKSSNTWKLDGFPTYVVVDRKGIVRSADLSPDHTEEVIKKLLAEPAL